MFSLPDQQKSEGHQPDKIKKQSKKQTYLLEGSRIQ